MERAVYTGKRLTPYREFEYVRDLLHNLHHHKNLLSVIKPPEVSGGKLITPGLYAFTPNSTFCRRVSQEYYDNVIIREGLRYLKTNPKGGRETDPVVEVQKVFEAELIAYERERIEGMVLVYEGFLREGIEWIPSFVVDIALTGKLNPFCLMSLNGWDLLAASDDEKDDMWENVLRAARPNRTFPTYPPWCYVGDTSLASDHLDVQVVRVHKQVVYARKKDYAGNYAAGLASPLSYLNPTTISPHPHHFVVDSVESLKILTLYGIYRTLRNITKAAQGEAMVLDRIIDVPISNLEDVFGLHQGFYLFEAQEAETKAKRVTEIIKILQGLNSSVSSRLVLLLNAESRVTYKTLKFRHTVYTDHVQNHAQPQATPIQLVTAPGLPTSSLRELDSLVAGVKQYRQLPGPNKLTLPFNDPVTPLLPATQRIEFLDMFTVAHTMLPLGIIPTGGPSVDIVSEYRDTHSIRKRIFASPMVKVGNSTFRNYSAVLTTKESIQIPGLQNIMQLSVARNMTNKDLVLFCGVANFTNMMNAAYPSFSLPAMAQTDVGLAASEKIISACQTYNKLAHKSNASTLKIFCLGVHAFCMTYGRGRTRTIGNTTPFSIKILGGITEPAAELLRKLGSVAVFGRNAVLPHTTAELEDMVTGPASVVISDIDAVQLSPADYVAQIRNIVERYRGCYLYVKLNYMDRGLAALLDQIAKYDIVRLGSSPTGGERWLIIEDGTPNFGVGGLTNMCSPLFSDLSKLSVSFPDTCGQVLTHNVPRAALFTKSLKRSSGDVQNIISTLDTARIGGIQGGDLCNIRGITSGLGSKEASSSGVALQNIDAMVLDSSPLSLSNEEHGMPATATDVLDAALKAEIQAWIKVQRNIIQLGMKAPTIVSWGGRDIASLGHIYDIPHFLVDIAELGTGNRAHQLFDNGHRVIYDTTKNLYANLVAVENLVTNKVANSVCIHVMKDFIIAMPLAMIPGLCNDVGTAIGLGSRIFANFFSDASTAGNHDVTFYSSDFSYRSGTLTMRSYPSNNIMIPTSHNAERISVSGGEILNQLVKEGKDLTQSSQTAGEFLIGLAAVLKS